MAAISSRQRKISAEQTDAKSAIVETYTEANCRYVILTAQMQSGKTTVYYFVGAEMLRLAKVKKVIIFSGNSEKELRDQVTNSAADKFFDLYARYLRESGMDEDESADVVEQIKPKFKVVWGAHNLVNYRCDDYTDTLYAWDESHFAQNNTMKPAEFLRFVGVAANGDPTVLEEKNNYFLSVSATPFSEASDLQHLGQFKRIVCLKPGAGYHSVEKMLANNTIIGFDDWKICLHNACVEMGGGFGLVRLRDGKTDNAAEAVRIATNSGCKVKFYDATTTAITSDQKVTSLQDELGRVPQVKTIIFLKGMCRMGKEVEKTNVSFVMETATKSKTDVVLQGLLGRMCGYHNHTNIRVYLNNNIVRSGELERFVDWTHEQNVLPRKANNLKMNSHASSKLHPIVPIKISRGSFVIDGSRDVEPVQENKQNLKESVIDIMLNKYNEVEDFNCETQKAEILEQMGSYEYEQFDVRIIRKDMSGNIECPKTYGKVPSKLHELFSTRTPGKLAENNGIKADGGIIKMYWFASSFPEYNIVRGDVFVDARTESCDENAQALNNIKQNIPITTKKEVFCRELETGATVENNGTYPISLKPETSTDVRTMLGSLEELIGLSLEESEFVNKPRNITSNQVKGSRWQGILVNDAVLQALKKDGIIYVVLEDKYKIKIKITKKSGPRAQQLISEGLTRLAEISW